MLVGDPKTGKTGDVIWAFPNALHFAAPGALKVADSVVGIEIPKERIRLISTVAAIVEEMKKPLPTGTIAVNVDDLTLVVDNSLRVYQSQGVDRFKLWGRIRNDLLDLRQAARSLGVHVCFTLHTKEPRYEESKMADGATVRRMIDPGGPSLPGQMMKGLPAICDMILHAKKRESFVSLWPVVYENEITDMKWTSIGNRELPPISPVPANLGEILRAAGHAIPEPFAGHEETTEKLSQAFEANAEKIADLILPAAAKLDAKYADRGARAWVRRTWVLRDALARAQLRMAIRAYHAIPRIYGGSTGATL